MGVVEGSKPDIQRRASVVVDTSFLLDLNLSMGYSLLAQRFILNEQPTVIVPKAVEREYSHRLTKGTLHDGVPIIFRESGIEKLLRTETYRVYDAPIQNTSADFKHDHPQRLLLLSSSDVSVIEAALNEADSGDVAVATADRDIVDKIRDICLNSDYDVEIYSPWTKSLVEISNALDLSMLVTKNVFRKLYETDMKDGQKRYLCVAKDFEIRGQGTFDMAFFVYTKVYDVTKRLPQFQGVYFMPIVLLEYRGETPFIADYIHTLTSNEVAIYSDEFPAIINIGKSNTPLKLHEVRRIGAALDNPRTSRKHLEQTYRQLPKMVNRELIKWARLDPQALKAHDRDAFQMLHFYTQELRSYMRQ